jgi:hypothetical protein
MAGGYTEVFISFTWNRCLQESTEGIDCMESMPGVLRSVKIHATDKEPNKISQNQKLILNVTFHLCFSEKFRDDRSTVPAHTLTHSHTHHITHKNLACLWEETYSIRNKEAISFSLSIHCRKILATFPSPAGMSLTKLSLGRINYNN